MTGRDRTRLRKLQDRWLGPAWPGPAGHGDAVRGEAWQGKAWPASAGQSTKEASMISSLAILGAGGDTKLTWDPNDPEDCERARETVAALKSRGFVFFLTDNRPADEINGGGDGTLIVRKLAAEEVVSEPEPAAEDVASEPATGNSPPTPKRQGRPPKAKPEGQNAVAVRPMRGG